MDSATLEQVEYAATWKKWEPKVITTVRQWALPGVIGCTFDDFYSLAQQVLLYTLQNFNSDKAKLSTFFYTNLHNAFKTEYSKSGMIRSGYKLKVTDKKTNEEKVFSRQYTSREEAAHDASMIRGRRSAVPVYHQENRFKRIPPNQLTPFIVTPDADNDNQTDKGVWSPHQRIGTIDRRHLDFKQWLKVIGQKVTDRVDRRLLLKLYAGDSLRKVTREMGLSRVDLNKRMKALRRVAVDVMRELQF